jgi:hypothetical protein
MSLAQQLYDHALHSILAFLPLVDVVSAAITCKAWMAACSRAHARPHWKLPVVRRPELLCSSPLRRLVSSLDLGALSSCEVLQSIAEALPHLKSLTHRSVVSMSVPCYASYDPSHPHPYYQFQQRAVRGVYAPSLRALTLMLPSREQLQGNAGAVVAAMQSSIDGVATATNLRTLELIVCQMSLDRVNLMPLVQLRHLSTLRFTPVPDLSPSNAQYSLCPVLLEVVVSCLR